MYCELVLPRVAALVLKLTLFFLLITTLCTCSSSRKGTVTDENGNVVADIVVRLVTINDRGVEQAVIESISTDTNGEFLFQTEVTENASVLISASLPSGELRGFAAGSGSAIPVSPLSNALVAVVIDITKTDGGRSVTDFEESELRSIASNLFDADATDLILTNTEAIKDFVRANVGREIAIASGGSITVETTDAFNTTQTTTSASFTTDTDVCFENIEYYLLTSDNFRFDIERDGTICGGTSATLDDMFGEGAFALSVPGNEFFPNRDVFPDDGTATLEDDRELALGPAKLSDPSVTFPDPPAEDSFQISRKVFVPETGDYIRYLEILTNTGSSDRTMSIHIDTTLETGTESALLTKDDANEALSIGDRFVVAYDQFQALPTVAFTFQDGLGQISNVSEVNAPGNTGGEADEVSYTWTDFTVPANSTRTFMHFAHLTTSRSDSELQTLITEFLENPDMTGLNITELLGLLNFTPGLGTVQGEAGSVIGRAEVTVTNTTSLQEITVKAKEDGSFSAPIDTTSNDTLNISADDGLSTTIQVP